MTCRNKLMNEGKPYPKSGCEVCGSMFGNGRLVCTEGVEPSGRIDAKYYIPTSLPEGASPRKDYAVVVQKIFVEDDGYGGRNTIKYNDFIEFDSEQGLKDWYANEYLNGSTYLRPVFVKAIRYETLKLSSEVIVSIS